MRPMLKTCPHCGAIYTYNPRNGDFGGICRYCGKTVTIIDHIAKIFKIFS